MNWLLCSCSPTEVHKKSALLDELILLMKRNTHFVTLTLKLKWQKIKPRFTAQTLGNFSLSSIYTLPNHRYFTGLKSKLSRMFAPISWNTLFLLLSFQILPPPPLNIWIYIYQNNIWNSNLFGRWPPPPPNFLEFWFTCKRSGTGGVETPRPPLFGEFQIGLGFP